MKLLLIRGDATRSISQESFFARGIYVTVTDEGAAGLARDFQGQVDMILFDSGAVIPAAVDVLRQLRQRSTTPVIVVGRRIGAGERIAALEAGADDCLSAPFDQTELVARMRAVLRRVRLVPRSIAGRLQVAGINLWPSKRIVERCGARAVLCPAECDILTLLMRHAGHAVSRDDVSWAIDQQSLESGERWIDARICHLRKTLTRLGAPDVIRSVRGIGYMLIQPEVQ